MPARNHLAMQLAMRSRLLSLVAATTGSTTLSATATGYARAAGSFLTDGFATGMEVAPTGFAQTGPAIIGKGVTATFLPIVGGRTAQAAAAGRSLIVGLPSMVAWENVDTIPITGQPYVEEQYLPGPAAVQEVGAGARNEIRPMYSPRIYVNADTDIAANGRYGDAILALFAPGTVMTTSDGTILCVRSDVAPFVGQRLPGVNDGWSCVPITIPFYTLN